MKNNLLFEELNTVTPPTEGIKYAGSKLKLLPQILSLCDGLDVETVLDGFSGSTRVSQAFAQLDYSVIASDRSVWSYTLGNCYLKNKAAKSEYQELIDHLNATPGYDGWFTENYGGLDYDGGAIQPDGSKKPWQSKNTRKLDGIRDEIDRLQLDELTKSVALTSLILAMDKVDSTLGHFTSYLKKWSPRSYNDMKLVVPKLFINEKENRVLKGDIFETLSDINCDLAYFDPPYGSNNEKMPPSRVRYSSYYHVWTSIIENDRPALFGAAGRREDTRDTNSSSVFEEFRKDSSGQFIAINAIKKLITEVKSKYVALSYSSGGRATAEELNQILKSNGNILKVIEVDYKKNVMAGMKWTDEWLRDAEEPHREFIFLLEK